MLKSAVRGQRPGRRSEIEVSETIQDGVRVQVVRNPRVEIIDVFRFFAALWVMLGHAGPFPLLEGVTKSHVHRACRPRRLQQPFVGRRL